MGMWRGNTKVASTGNEVFVMVVLVLVAIVGVGWFSLWDAGYLGSYWERWDRGGDIKCFDTQGHFTTSGKQTCFVLTQRGLNARERLTEECKEKGEDSETCLEQALKQLTSSLPSTSH